MTNGLVRPEPFDSPFSLYLRIEDPDDGNDDLDDDEDDFFDTDEDDDDGEDEEDDEDDVETWQVHDLRSEFR